MMNQLTPSPTNCNLKDLPEFLRLFHYIQSSAIDSEGISIKAEEVPQIINAVIRRLIWRSSQLDQIIQEELDELHFGVSVVPLDNEVELVGD